MNAIVHFFVSGWSFYAGWTLTMVWSVLVPESRWLRVVTRKLLFMGVVLVVFSTVPQPWWLALLCAGGVIAGVIARRLPRVECSARRATSRWLFYTPLVSAMLAIAFDVQDVSSLEPRRSRITRLDVIGDSLSANDGEARPWPALLKGRIPVVVNHAAVGATTASAKKQIEELPESGLDCVVLEIGGNDLLSGLPAATFREQLDQRLTELKRKGVRVILMELPLPPFCHAYGRAQRELAHKHGVEMIPRHVLSSAILSANGNDDGLHLSTTGHLRLARTLSGLLFQHEI